MYKIIALFLLFFEFSIVPFASYRLLINSEGKVALIFGDYHNTELDLMNEMHVNLLCACIQKAPSSKKFTCLTGALKTASSKVNIIVAKTFRYLEDQKAVMHEQVDFLDSDPRDDRITCYISTFMRICQQKLLAPLEVQGLAKNIFEGTEIEYGSKVLISELSSYLEKAHANMVTWLGEYTAGSSERQLLQKKIDVFKINSNALKKYISIFTKDLSFQEAVLVLLSLQTTYNSRNIFLELQELIKLTVHEYAVIAYLHAFLIDQRSNVGTMCILSQDQATVLNSLLQDLHYTVLGNESIVVPSYGRWGKPRIRNTQSFYKNILNVFSSFNSIRIAYEEQLLTENMLPYIVECVKEKMVISDEPVCEPYKACDTCLKNVGKLSLCSKCKNIYYCSVYCQQLDWPEHKKTCKKKE